MTTSDGGRAAPITLPDLHLDPASASAWWQGAPLDLHPNEFRLLHALAARAGQAVSTDRLARAMWGSATKVGAAYVALYVRYLQRKLEVDPERPRVLRAVRGGYRLTLPPNAPARVPVWWLLHPG